MLSSQEHLIEVCSEETIADIEKRYLVHNAHSTSYTWKYDGNVLDVAKTLEENGVIDESAAFQALSIDESNEACISEVQVYYNDDLTIG